MKQSLKKSTILLFLLLLAIPLFSQQIVPAGMQSLADTLYEQVFNSNLVRVILAICLAGAALAYAFNKDNERIKKSALTIGIAAAILISAKEIVNAVWNASGGTN